MIWLWFSFLLLIAVTVSLWASYFFQSPIDSVLRRLINDPVSRAWMMYFKFAIVVAGLSGGLGPRRVAMIVAPETGTAGSRSLIHWVAEGYSTAIGAAYGIMLLLLTFFLVAILAQVILRVMFTQRSSSQNPNRSFNRPPRRNKPPPQQPQ